MKRIKFWGLIISSFILSGIVFSSCSEQAFENHDTIPIVQKALYDTTSVYYSNFGKFPYQNDTLPIGIIEFDTINPMALTLLQLERFNNITGKEGDDHIPDFAGEKFQLLQDLENYPYNDYLDADREDYLREIVVKNALFLLSDKYYIHSSDKVAKGVKSPCKIIIVSSPIASAYGLSDIRQMLRIAKLDVKVLGVIEPTVRGVYNEIKNSKSDSLTIGILDTGEGVLFERAISDIKKKAKDVKSFSTLSGTIKEPLTDSLIRESIVSMIDSIESLPTQMPLKCLVLSSWEQALFSSTIISVIEELKSHTVNGRKIYAHLIDKDFKLIIPFECTAKECYNYLRNDNLLAFNPNDNQIEVFKSVPNYTVDTEYLDSEGFLTSEFKLSREVGKEEETTVIVKEK